MNFKRFNGSTWETVQHKIYGSGTDSLTAFPAVIQASGEPLTDYTICGNTVQDGTPTPDSPVMPQGTGERTGNLFDVANLSNVRWATPYPLLLTAINSLPNGVYTMSISFELTSRNDTTDSSTCGWYIAKDSRVLSNIRRSWETAQIGEIITAVDTFTINDNNRGAFTALYLYGCGINSVGATGSANAENIMLNLGSTALPYEPYGYKLPLTVNGTEHPIYLGQCESTRRIKKLVLTGAESDWRTSGEGSTRLYNHTIGTGVSYSSEALCNVAEYSDSVAASSGVAFDIVAYQGSLVIRFHAIDYETLNDFKSYLAAQYAAGTPVTIWYVLAEPETAVVNEPLHKIGDYADTITMAQAGVTIPTFDGDNIISFGTAVQPSAMSAAFKGWHPVQGVKQYDGSEWR